MQWPWNPGQWSFKVIVTNTDRSAAYDFLSTFHSNHGAISHLFRDKRRFPSKIPNFPHPRVFCAPAEGVPLGIGYRRWWWWTVMTMMTNCSRYLTGVVIPCSVSGAQHSRSQSSVVVKTATFVVRNNRQLHLPGVQHATARVLHYSTQTHLSVRSLDIYTIKKLKAQIRKAPKLRIVLVLFRQELSLCRMSVYKFEHDMFRLPLKMRYLPCMCLVYVWEVLVSQKNTRPDFDQIFRMDML